MFTFSFNLVVSRDGEVVRFPLNKTCSPALAWAPREVTCETNYMEVTEMHPGFERLIFEMLAVLLLLKVSVTSDEACPTGTKEDDWDASAQMVTWNYLEEFLH